MNCSCADANCEHRKNKKPLHHYAFTSGFRGTQQDYHKQQEKVREWNEWNEIFDLLELEDKKLKSAK